MQNAEGEDAEMLRMTRIRCFKIWKLNLLEKMLTKRIIRETRLSKYITLEEKLGRLHDQKIKTLEQFLSSRSKHH